MRDDRNPQCVSSGLGGGVASWGNRQFQAGPAPGGDEELRLMGSFDLFDVFEVGCRAMPGIGTPGLGHRPDRVNSAFDRSLELLDADGNIVQLGGGDDEVGGIHNGLAGMGAMAGTIRSLHDSCVRVCEVPLRRGFGLRLGSSFLPDGGDVTGFITALTSSARIFCLPVSRA